MNSSLLNLLMIVGLLGLSFHASASLITCSSATDQSGECQRNFLLTQKPFAITMFNPTPFWDIKDNLFPVADELDGQFNITALVANNGLKDLCLDDCGKEGTSLISYYARGVVVRVSEPAPLLLVVLGMLGLQLVRRRLR